MRAGLVIRCRHAAEAQLGGVQSLLLQVLLHLGRGGETCPCPVRESASHVDCVMLQPRSGRGICITEW